MAGGRRGWRCPMSTETHLPSPAIKKKSPLQNTALSEVHQSFTNTNYFLPVFQAIITFKA
jgi:hypothetical protein